MIKSISKLVSEIRNNLTAKKLFLSPRFSRYLQNIAMGLTKRFKKPPIFNVFEADENTTAFTNNKAVGINYNCDLVQQSFGRQSTFVEIFRSIRALAAHEIGHILFTDFKLRRRISDTMTADKKLYPLCDFVDEVPNAEEILEYCEKRAGQILNIYLSFDNILEDSYVNSSVTSGRYPIGEDLSWFIKKVKLTLPPFEDMLQLAEGESQEANTVRTIKNLLLSYAVYGKIDCSILHKRHPLIQKLYSISGDIDDVKMDDDPYIRNCHYQKIFAYFWEEIKAYLDTLPEPEEANDGSATEDMNKNQQGSSNSPSGNGGSDMEQSSSSKPSAKSKEEAKQMMGQAPKASGNSQDQGGQGGATCSENSATEDSDKSKAAESLKRLINEVADEEAEKQMLEEEEKELSNQAKQLERSRDDRCRVDRMTEVSDRNIADYDAVKGEVLKVSKRLSRLFEQKLKDRRNGSKMSGFYSGRTISVQAASRKQLGIFEKRTLPSNYPKVAVAYLGDESGSMFDNSKFIANRNTALVIYSFCEQLDLPVGIYGHDECGSVNFKVYSDFKRNKNDKYRIMNISAGSCNRDGFALKLAMNRLLKQDADHRILIITSDGLPSAYCSREEGIADIKSVVSECKRNSITLIAAAMDEDKETIKEIYGDSYLDISDLDKMPQKLVSMLGKYLK